MKKLLWAWRIRRVWKQSVCVCRGDNPLSEFYSNIGYEIACGRLPKDVFEQFKFTHIQS
jgi:hypothetical protein